MFIDNLVSRIKAHPCYAHPVFQHWAETAPEPATIGALFHQISNFCAATRPGVNLPTALRNFSLDQGSDLLQQIVESEEDHGPQLATMAGHIVNRAAGEKVFADLYDQAAVENGLKEYSAQLLGSLPGFDSATGLMPQTKKAIAVFDGRQRTDEASTYRNLGTTLALEMISNRHLIPGEKQCLVDSGLYSVSLEEPEMHYLLEHWGEAGAEAVHEQHARDAISSVPTSNIIVELVNAGADDFLDSLNSMWNLLDAALLASGMHRPSRRLAVG